MTDQFGSYTHLGDVVWESFWLNNEPERKAFLPTWLRLIADDIEGANADD